ncbi:MAG: RsmB/NOP family class I SAM-dependent RNA methyltransferase [Clostridia bacterium]|nr:RsmB/NOP family class I SAM-dependent RNA methyltransferase [Clostridia bacterium]
MKENIPEFLQEILLNEYGEKLTNQIINGYTKNRPTTLRVNTSKVNIEDIKQTLKELKIIFKEVPWNETAIIIEDIKENEIKELDIYKNGEIYLQSLSSMIPPFVVNPKEGENILDMAAAPGGKTTQMANLSNNKAMITACEKNKIRAERLKYNLEKQGTSRVTVMLKDARKLDDFFSFDKILLDAPCSGSGTLNLNQTDIEKVFTKELVERSIKTQKELLKKAVKILKTNGELIYSTCSILKEENEKVVEEILKLGNVEIVPIDAEKFKDIPLLPVNIEGTICVCPNELYEGFFVAKLRKNL